MGIELSALMPPGAEDRLIEHMIAKKRLLIAATQPELAASLIPWSVINQLIATGALPHEHLRLIRSNRTVPYEMFTRPGPKLEVRGSALHQLVGQGVSVIINRIDKYAPKVAELSASLERLIGSEIQVNCYMSFAKDNAFLAHHDGHDVIVVQIHGRKHWRTFGMHREGQPKMTAQEAKTAVPEWEQTLSPGDILYVPRGEIHDASALSSDSLHLTIGIHHRTGADLLRWLADRAAGSESPLNRGLVRLGGSQAIARQEADLKEHMLALIEGLDLSRYLDDEDARRPPRPLVSIPLIKDLSPATRVALLLRRNIKMADSDQDEVPMVIGGEDMRLGRSERAVLSLLMKHAERMLSDIAQALSAELTKPEVEAALHALAAKGLVALIEESPH